MRVLDRDRNFLGLDREWSDFARAGVVVLPVPYEQTSSYGRGSARGPAALLAASRQLELYDARHDAEPYRWCNGIATLEPLAVGDCTGEEMVTAVARRVAELLQTGKFVVTLGGEHTVSVGAAKAHTEHFPGLGTLQLDAHADLRQEYGKNPYSHACTMARIHEFNRNIVQAGVRSLSAEEARWREAQGIRTFFADARAAADGVPIDEIVDACADPVYLTIDCDYFDPSLVPGVGTPEPGGADWPQAVALVHALVSRRRLVGIDICELRPMPGSTRSEFTMAKFVYVILGAAFASASKEEKE